MVFEGDNSGRALLGSGPVGDRQRPMAYGLWPMTYGGTMATTSAEGVNRGKIIGAIK